MLRSHDSPERRGLVDALDNDVLNLDHPVLEPESSASSDVESFKSFKVASSLGSPSTIGGEVETGTAVMVKGEILNSVFEKDLAKAKAVNAIPVRNSNYGSSIERVYVFMILLDFLS
jgi:hypothetical protein